MSTQATSSQVGFGFLQDSFNSKLKV